MPDPIPPPRSFAVVAPGAATRLASMVVWALVLVPFVGLVVALVPAGPQTVQAWLLLVGMAGCLALIVSLLYMSLHRRSVTLENGFLVIRAGLNTHRVAVSAFDLERVRIIDLAERTELRPMIRTNGVSLPGLHAGWFRMRDRWRKGFYLVTDRRRVLWLPEREGVQLLLSLEKPQALLSALKDMAQRRDAR